MATLNEELVSGTGQGTSTPDVTKKYDKFVGTYANDRVEKGRAKTQPGPHANQKKTFNVR